MMDLPINSNKPLIMHIDINSCFATVLQQAYQNLRNKPLVIAAYTSPGGCILASSIEAKKLGIKTGMKVYEAQSIYKNIIIKTTEVELINNFHSQFIKILQKHCCEVIPKSIDEAILDFSNLADNEKINMVEIAKKIKLDIKNNIGEWISCSVGIGTNRFLAKTAASFKKPNGLTIIDSNNVKTIYSQLKLLDLYGINKQLACRLQMNKIKTPLDFLASNIFCLQKKVFKSINGFYWYKRLRGWEIDNVKSDRKSFGQQYALPKATSDKFEVENIILKLTEKMSHRLRNAGFYTKGISVSFLYKDYSSFQKNHLTNKAIYNTLDIFKELICLYNKSPQKPIIKISVSCFGLQNIKNFQMDLFNDLSKQKNITDIVDSINNKYGELTVFPCSIKDINKKIINRIGFGRIN